MGANAPFSTRGQGGEGERVCPRTGTEKTSLLPPTLVFQRAGEHDGEACLRRPYKLTITAARPPCCRTGLQSAGGAGFVLTDSATGEVIEEGALPVNQATTVECEYLAILAGLCVCVKTTVTRRRPSTYPPCSIRALDANCRLVLSELLVYGLDHQC